MSLTATENHPDTISFAGVDSETAITLTHAAATYAPEIVDAQGAPKSVIEDTTRQGRALVMQAVRDSYKTPAATVRDVSILYGADPEATLDSGSSFVQDERLNNERMPETTKVSRTVAEVLARSAVRQAFRASDPTYHQAAVNALGWLKEHPDTEPVVREVYTPATELRLRATWAGRRMLHKIFPQRSGH
jgi:hypothetical protein